MNDSPAAFELGDAERSKSTAFEQLYDRECLRQVRTVALVLGDASCAEEVVHDAFVGLWRSWDRVDQPAAYLQRSVFNGVRTYQRRAAIRRLLNQEEFDAFLTVDPEDDYIIDALHELPYKQRAVIVLKYYQGLGEREIAQALAIPNGSVGPLLNRARSFLRRRLSNDF